MLGKIILAIIIIFLIGMLITFVQNQLGFFIALIMIVGAIFGTVLYYFWDDIGVPPY